MRTETANGIKIMNQKMSQNQEPQTGALKQLNGSAASFKTNALLFGRIKEKSNAYMPNMSKQRYIRKTRRESDLSVNNQVPLSINHVGNHHY